MISPKDGEEAATCRRVLYVLELVQVVGDMLVYKI